MTGIISWKSRIGMNVLLNSKFLHLDTLYIEYNKILFSKQDSVLEVISRLILVWESRIKHCISTRNLISIFLKIK